MMGLDVILFKAYPTIAATSATATVNHNVADILTGAAEAIRRHGLAKRVLQDTDGGLCARGAMMWALGIRQDRAGALSWDLLWRQPHLRAAFEAADLALSAFLVPTRPTRGAVATWNNTQSRTEGEVIAALEACAAIERARQNLPSARTAVALAWEVA